MHTIFHLVLGSDWAAQMVDGCYRPVRFENDGFVHCTGDLAASLEVAESYFSKAIEPVLLVELEIEKLGSEVKWEAPIAVAAGLQKHHVPGRLFPTSTARFRLQR